MQIVRDLAGYSLGRSDMVRRAMAKKKASEMEREKKVFVEGAVDENGNVTVPGAVRMGTPADVALQIFAEMESFAQYAFNKSHAAAYAVVTWQTAYLKCHYPVQFMAAILNSVAGNAGKISAFIQYCRKHDIPVLPPDVNRSQAKFSVEGNAIRYGLGAIRNVGANAVAAIIRGRKDRPYTDLYDFMERIELEFINKRVVESLIKSGAMDVFDGYRTQKLAVYETIMDSETNRRKTMITGQLSLFGEDTLAAPRQALPKLGEMSKRLMLQSEKEMTGVYITGHPLDEYRDRLEKMPYNVNVVTEYSEEENWEKYDRMPIALSGMIIEMRMNTTKNNKLMCFITLEDLYGTIECLVFPKVYERLSRWIQVDAAVTLQGTLSLREDEAPKLLVDSIVPLDGGGEEEKPARPRRFYVKIDDRALVPMVQNLLQNYAGSVPVRAVIEGKVYDLPQGYNVNPNQMLVHSLENLLGEGTAKLA